MATKFFIGTSANSDFTATASWSDGVAPANGDILIFNGAGTGTVTSNLSTALTGVTVIVERSFTGGIGNVATGAATYLVLDGGTLKMPRTTGSLSPSGSGSPRVFINFGSTAATVDIDVTNTSGTETYYPPVQLRGTAITATIRGGVVGFAARPGETSTLASLRTIRGPEGEPTVYLGPGVTLTAAVFDAGMIYDRRDNTATTVRIGGATYEYSGSGATTNLLVDSGKCRYSGTGTVTTATLRGELDFSQDARSKTFTTLDTFGGAVLNLDNGVPGSVVFTNAINHNDGIGPNGCTIITPAAVKGTLLNI